MSRAWATTSCPATRSAASPPAGSTRTSRTRRSGRSARRKPRRRRRWKPSSARGQDRMHREQAGVMPDAAQASMRSFTLKRRQHPMPSGAAPDVATRSAAPKPPTPWDGALLAGITADWPHAPRRHPAPTPPLPLASTPADHDGVDRTPKRQHAMHRERFAAAVRHAGDPAGVAVACRCTGRILRGEFRGGFRGEPRSIIQRPGTAVPMPPRCSAESSAESPRSFNPAVRSDPDQGTSPRAAAGPDERPVIQPGVRGDARTPCNVRAASSWRVVADRPRAPVPSGDRDAMHRETPRPSQPGATGCANNPMSSGAPARRTTSCARAPRRRRSTTETGSPLRAGCGVPPLIQHRERFAAAVRHAGGPAGVAVACRCTGRILRGEFREGSAENRGASSNDLARQYQCLRVAPRNPPRNLRVVSIRPSGQTLTREHLPAQPRDPMSAPSSNQASAATQEPPTT